MNRVRGFHHGFAKGRVGVDRLAEFASRDFKVKRGTRFRDQVGGMRANDVNTEDLIGLGVRDDLAETDGLIDRHGLAESGEGELADTGFDPLLVALFLALADGTDFRGSEDAARNKRTVEGVLLAAGDIRRNNAQIGRASCRERV